jgi:hypothetical protein
MRKKTLRNGDNLPSYIPASNFAMALLDAAARGTDAHDPRAAGPDARPLTLESVRSGITQLQSPIVQRALLAAIDAAEGNLAKAQENVEAWFNGAMDRVSGWYKRRTQWILLLIGIVLSVAMNVNSIGIATALLRNAPLRQAVVAQAEKIVADSAIPEANFQKQRAMIDSLGLPIGWGYGYHGPPEAQWGNPDTVWGLLTPMVGWLLTAFAVTLGAPFWFDLLNKVMVIRSTVKPHEKSPEEASEDRQARTSTPPPTLGANQLAGVGAGTGSAAAGGAASGAIGGGTGGAAAQPPSPAEAFEAHEWADGNPQEGLI